jgi:hypothetical protein
MRDLIAEQPRGDDSDLLGYLRGVANGDPA